MFDSLKDIVQIVPAPVLLGYFVWKIVEKQRIKKNGNSNGTTRAVVQNAEQQQMLLHVKEGIAGMAKRVDEIGEHTSDTLRLLDKYDEDGVPLCYVPRSWATMQRETVAAIREISETQRAICSTLTIMSRMLEKLLDKA